MSSHLLNEAEASGARPIWLVGEQGFGAWLEVQPPSVRSWVRAQGFQAERHRLLVLPTAAGDGILGAALGLGPTPDLSEPNMWMSAGLPDRLPAGRYRFAGSYALRSKRVAQARSSTRGQTSGTAAGRTWRTGRSG